jgi:hypothetical protein
MAMLNDQRVSLRILAEESHFFFARKIDGRLFFAFVRKLQFEIKICLLNLGQMKIWPFLVGIWIFKFVQESIFSFGDYWWTLTNKTKNMVMWWFFM